MDQRSTQRFQRDDQERHKLRNGVIVFTPKGYQLSQLEANKLEDICQELGMVVAPVRIIHLNADKDKAERAHNMSFTFNWENAALRRD